MSSQLSYSLVLIMNETVALFPVTSRGDTKHSVWPYTRSGQTLVQDINDCTQLLSAVFAKAGGQLSFIDLERRSTGF